jgi:uncharacterized membrane protein
MEAFSDGVFSIAATLLVLDLALRPPGTALEQLWRAWPGYLGYVVSFLTIGAAWLAHSALTDRLTRADSLLLRINLLLLLVVAFLPFPTRLVAESLHDISDERVFVTLYGVTLLSIRLLGLTLGWYAERRQLLAPPGDDDEAPPARRDVLAITAAYVMAILIGLLAPFVAVGLYCLLAAVLVVPFRELRAVARQP